ncbi:hypothetical protein MGN70_004267 [Eutypa lata]|nr:hypothetical protein MGN70_004267 [Eutypa lata]
MSNHSHSFARRCNLLDYIGILALIWGAGIATIYYGFFCDPHLRTFYWTTTSITALGCTILTLSPHFSKPGVRHWRAGFYAGFALSSIVFVVHGLLIHGWELQKSRMSLAWIGWMGMSALVGTSIYVARLTSS